MNLKNLLQQTRGITFGSATLFFITLFIGGLFSFAGVFNEEAYIAFQIIAVGAWVIATWIPYKYDEENAMKTVFNTWLVANGFNVIVNGIRHMSDYEGLFIIIGTILIFLVRLIVVKTYPNKRHIIS